MQTPQIPPSDGQLLFETGIKIQQNYLPQNMGIQVVHAEMQSASIATQPSLSSIQSPRSLMQSPQSVMLSPQSVMQSPQSVMQSSQSVMQSPQSGMQCENGMQSIQNYITPFHQHFENNVMQMPRGVQLSQYNGMPQCQDAIHTPDNTQQLLNVETEDQSGLRLVHQGVVHEPISAGGGLPYSPPSEDDLYDLDFLKELVMFLRIF